MKHYLTGIVMLCVAAAASGEIIISSDAGPLGIGTNEKLHFYARGNSPVWGLEFNIQINDGGSDLGGSSLGPVIKSVDLVDDNGPGTIFKGKGPNKAHPVSFPLAAQATVDISGTVVPDGLFAIVTLDTSLLSEEDTFEVSLMGVAGSFDTIFRDPNGNGLSTRFDADSKTDGVQDGAMLVALPEPMTLGLLGVGGLLLARRRR